MSLKLELQLQTQRRRRPFVTAEEKVAAEDHSWMYKDENALLSYGKHTDEELCFCKPCADARYGVVKKEDDHE